jgi:Transposase
MQAVTTIGLDIAKSVFQVHGVDAEGRVVIRRQLKRRYVLSFFEKLQPCLVGIEACASSHHWSRELRALGHTVRLMPPAYVRPYVKRQKNDAADAEAICEAVARANMRFVATKTPEQQSGLMLHRTRHLFIRQQTAVINAIRAHLAEFGIVAPVGRQGVDELLRIVADPSDKRLRGRARLCRGSWHSIADAEDTDFAVRPHDHGLASIQRGEQAARQASRRGTGTSDRLGCQCRRCKGFSIRTGLLGLDRAGAEAELERRQGQTRQYQQTRRSLSSQPVHGRRARRDPVRQNTRHRAPAVAHHIIG